MCVPCSGFGGLWEAQLAALGLSQEPLREGLLLLQQEMCPSMLWLSTHPDLCSLHHHSLDVYVPRAVYRRPDTQ